MPMISERVSVNCPYEQSGPFLMAHLGDLTKSESGSEGAFRLTLPVSELGLPGGVSLTRDVDAHFVPLKEPQGGSKFAAVHWVPVGGGPFPQLLGLFGIEADADPKKCTLVLEGNYDPPMGVAGDLFDAVVGRKIAKSSIHELLKALAHVLEARCGANHIEGKIQHR